MSQSSPNYPADKRHPFTGAEGAPLDLATAASWTAADRHRHSDEVRAYFFGRQIIERILAQPGCVGLRVHYAIDPKTGVRHLLIVGADAQQNDQLPRLREPMQLAEGAAAPPLPAQPNMPAQPAGAQEATIAEMAIPCPNQCGDDNPLNGGGKG